MLRRGGGICGLVLLAVLSACSTSPAPPATMPVPTVTTTASNPASATIVAPPVVATTTSAMPIVPISRPTSPSGSPVAVGSPPIAASPSRSATPGATTYPLAVQDIAGRRVTIPRRPERIVSPSPANTETLFALGLGGHLVGVDQSSDYPPEARDLPKIGTFSQPTLEAVLAASPDLVLAANIHLRGAVPVLEARGVPVVVLNPVDLPAVLESFTLVGQITDSAVAAQRLREEQEGRIATVETRLRGVTTPPRVYVEITPKFVAVGPNSYIGDLIARAGGSNIVTDRSTQYPPLSAETIIGADPEVILLTDIGAEVTEASVGERPGWAGISAVRNKRVTGIDPNLLNRAGPRVVEALEFLARLCHPERFP